MREEMFLEPEYLKTLRLIVAWEKAPRCGGRRGESLSKVFVLRMRHYSDDNEYYQDIYLMPDKKGIYLLCLLSRSYSNVKVVPQVVWDLVKKIKEEESLTIMQLYENIGGVKLAKVASGEDERMTFGFWAVKFVPFKGLTQGLFRDELDHFSYKVNRLENDFDNLY